MRQNGSLSSSQQSHPNVKINYSTNQSIHSNQMVFSSQQQPKQFNVDVRVKVNTETGKVILTVPTQQPVQRFVTTNMPIPSNNNMVQSARFSEKSYYSTEQQPYYVENNLIYSRSSHNSQYNQPVQSFQQFPQQVYQPPVVYQNPYQFQQQSPINNLHQSAVYCGVCNKHIQHWQFEQHTEAHRQPAVMLSSRSSVQQTPVSNLQEMSFKKNLVHNDSPKFVNNHSISFNKFQEPMLEPLNESKVSLKSIQKSSEQFPLETLSNKSLKSIPFQPQKEISMISGKNNSDEQDLKSYKYHEEESLDLNDFNNNTNMDSEYNYQRKKRSYQVVEQKSIMVNRTKQKIPKNLLAVEPTIQQRKEKELQQRERKLREMKW